MKQLFALHALFFLFTVGVEGWNDIRLVGGSNEREGRLEIKLGRIWGTICHDHWDSNDARVACRQLGFGPPMDSRVELSLFGAGSGEILLDDVNCNGDEESLFSCRHLGLGTHNCDHSEDVAMRCSAAVEGQNAIRLVGGVNDREGRLEVQVDGIWGTVCDDEWGSNDARVACRQLGFGAPTETRAELSLFGAGSGEIVLDDLTCNGDEEWLVSCEHGGLGNHNCDHSEDVAIRCSVAGVERQNAIRLVGGVDEREGRLEVQVDGIWGTVCDDEWGPEDARVACRQLGFGAPTETRVELSLFGTGSGEIVLDDLTCNGDEEWLVSCRHGGLWNHNCDHSEDVAIRCAAAGTEMCALRGLCSQQCISAGDTYTCHCYHGYQMSQDGWTCKSSSPESPYLLFSSRYQVMQIDLNTNESNILIPNLRNTIALDYHFKESTVYYSDVVDDKIFRGVLDGASSNAGLQRFEPVVELGLATSEGLAVDWIGGNLYWVESYLNQIEVARLDGSMRTTVVAGNMGNPRAIAVDPNVGLMFWTDWQPGSPRIERATMSGADRRTIVDITRLEGGWPNGLTLDYPEQRCYWVDAKSEKIHASLYDGSGIFTVLEHQTYLSHPFAITVFEARVFWTDWRTNAIVQANKFNGTNVQEIQRMINQPFGLVVYHSSRQPQIPNLCGHNNGGCSDLCLLNGVGTACVCPYLKKPAADKVTCVSDPAFLVFSHGRDIRGVDLEDGYYNMIPALISRSADIGRSIDWDPVEKRIYWTDHYRRSINRAYINGTSIETVIEDIPNAYNLNIDWVSRNIYWMTVGPEYNTVNIARLDGRFQKTIPSLQLTNPKSVVIDPIGGMMYWINAGDSPSIQRAWMDGSNQMSLIERPLFFNATSLTIDRSAQRLYWLDTACSIQSSSLEGGDIQELLKLGATCAPTALTVTNDRVYWADNEIGVIKFVNKNDVSEITVLRRNTSDVTDMFIYNPSLQSGGNACEDQNGGCEHLCLPLPSNGRKCLCMAGFVHSTDGTSCDGVSEFLFYSSDDSIQSLSLTHTTDSNDVLTPITGHMPSMAMDFEAAKEFIYWVDTGMSTLNRIKTDHTERQVFLTDANIRIEGIAVDWIAGNIYWTDQENDVIEVSRTNGSHRYILIGTGLDEPRSIVVHLTRGYLFWADGGVHPKIERALLNGDSRTVIVESDDITSPSALVIDLEEDMLYWCDDQRDIVSRVDLNGNNYKVILGMASYMGDPYAITLFKDCLYFTDRSYLDGSIGWINKTGDTAVTWMQSGIGSSLKDVHVYSLLRQPDNSRNPCSADNGNCNQLCFYLGGMERSCACAHGMLAEDGVSCAEYDAYIVYSERTIMKSINLLDTADKNQPIPSLSNNNMRNAIGLAADHQGKRIFFTDILMGNIQVTNIKNGTGHETIASGIGSAEGLAYDSSSKMLYWTSYTHSLISRLLVENSTNREVLVRLTDRDHPRGIALDSCQSLMFWTNWNEENPRIQRAALNGQNLTDIIVTEIQVPNGIAIDHMSRLLFWGDARQDKIERCDYNGNNRVVLSMGFPAHPFDLVIFGNYTYWTDWVRRAVLRVNKYTGEEEMVVRSTISQQPMGLIVMATDADNCSAWPCHLNNGGCDGVCETDERGHVTCSCPMGQVLIDGTRCVAQECPFLETPPLVEVSGCQMSWDSLPTYGTNCTFLCPVGYVGVGEPSKSCQADGTWSSTDFQCRRFECEALGEAPQNGSLQCTDEAYYGSVCTYQCASGYALQPTGAVLFCAATGWTGTPPQCIRLM